MNDILKKCYLLFFGPTSRGSFKIPSVGLSSDLKIGRVGFFGKKCYSGVFGPKRANVGL